MEVDGYVAFPVRRLHGDPHPAGEGDPTRLRDLLDAIHSVDVSRFRGQLAPARQFAGGASWEAVLREEVVPRLDRALRDNARSRIDALANLPESELSFNHGDLAGSNVLWSHGRVAGVLDWDLAAWDDPAEDVAAPRFLARLVIAPADRRSRNRSTSGRVPAQLSAPDHRVRDH